MGILMRLFGQRLHVYAKVVDENDKTYTIDTPVDILFMDENDIENEIKRELRKKYGVNAKNITMQITKRS